MPSLIRFVSFLGLLAVLAYTGMFALVSWVEPTQREFVVTIRRIAWARRRPAPPTQTPSAIRRRPVRTGCRASSPGWRGCSRAYKYRGDAGGILPAYHHKARGSSDAF
jgi:hypothetical protein